ncbi:PH domain-containing protein [Paenibacillus sp. GCM10023252]|uniref:PH domain-containing protein n=1 Tax=Paenibacillus sp. GCM10023252 TaxID=3252649 RepID=UPI00361A714B
MNKPNKHKLHPIYITFLLFQVIQGLLPFLLLAQLRGIDWTDLPAYAYGAIVGVPIVLLLFGYMGWRSYSFNLDSDRMIIKRGMLFRDEKTIYYSRIHSVNVEQPLLQRLLKIAQVKIETPGGKTQADGILPALSLKEAYALRDLLRSYEDVKEESKIQSLEAAVPSAPITLNAHSALSASSTDPILAPDEMPQAIRIGGGQLMLAAATTTNFGLVAAFVAGLYSFADDIINQFAPDHFLESMFEDTVTSIPGYVTILAAAGAALLGAWLLSILLYVLKYSGFTVSKTGDQISLSYGLLEKRTHLFHPGKVQAVIVKEGLLRQLLGCAQIELQVLSSDKQQALMLHPFIRRGQLREILGLFLPQFEVNSITQPAPRRALLYYSRWYLVLVTLLSTISIAWLDWSGAWSLLLIPLVYIWRWASWRSAGIHLSPKQLTMRKRYLARSTYMVRRSQIVAMRVKGTPGQRKNHILSLRVYIMGSSLGYGVSCLEASAVGTVWDWYKRKPRANK